MTGRRLAAALATVLLAALAPVTAAGPAAAASGYCPKGSGVTVVVDRGALGGGTSIGCDPKGANTAGSTVVPRAGFPLTYVQSQPGFVCRVSGIPASASCGSTPPSNAYWGLFWSNGKSGSWSYASTGVGSLKVPAGGFIGWKWQNSNTRSNPGTAPVSPVAAKPTPKPAPKPAPKRAPQHSSRPSPKPAAGSPSSAARAGSGAASASASGSPGATARAVARQKAVQQKKKKAAKRAVRTKAAAKKKQATASASASASASQSAAAAGQDGSSSSPRTNLTSGEQAPDGPAPMLPLLAAGIVVVLLGVAGRLAWVRRKG